MAGRFEEWISGWRLGINGPNFRALMGGFAAVLGDRMEELARQAVRESLPSLAADDASLGLIGNDLGLPRAPSMSTEDYRAFLQHGISLNRMRVTGLGMCVGLYYADFPGAVVIQQNGLAYQITGTPNLDDVDLMADPATTLESRVLPAWITRTYLANSNKYLPASTDGRPAVPALTIPWLNIDTDMDAEGNQYNSRFAVLFPADVDDPALGTSANLARIRSTIAAWKPAKTTCAKIVVCTSGHVWGWPPSMKWGDVGLVWGGAVTTYTA